MGSNPGSNHGSNPVLAHHRPGECLASIVSASAAYYIVRYINNNRAVSGYRDVIVLELFKERLLSFVA